MSRITMTVLSVLILISACTSGSKTGTNRQLPVYLDESKTIDERVEDIIPRLTLEEKVALCHAQSKFSSPGVQRLGIPELWMNDGPFGVRSEVLYNSWTKAETTNDSCTAFPALTVLASSWNMELASQYGQALSEEANYREKAMQGGRSHLYGIAPFHGMPVTVLGHRKGTTLEENLRCTTSACQNPKANHKALRRVIERAENSGGP